MNNAAQITAQRLREAGINVELATSDWGGVDHAPRRQGAARPGRLEHLHHLGRGAASVGNPIAFAGHRRERREGLVRLADSNEPHEKLRDKWAAAGDAATSRRRSRARSRRTPGISCRMSGSGSGSRRSPTAEPQGRADDPGDHPVLEYREDLSRSLKRKRPARAGRFFGRASALLHQARAAERRLLVLAQDAEAAGDLGVGLDQAAEVAAEAVLVQLVAGS